VACHVGIDAEVAMSHRVPHRQRRRGELGQGMRGGGRLEFLPAMAVRLGVEHKLAAGTLRRIAKLLVAVTGLGDRRSDDRRWLEMGKVAGANGNGHGLC